VVSGHANQAADDGFAPSPALVIRVNSKVGRVGAVETVGHRTFRTDEPAV
jgi:hypothetical protein